MSDRFIEYDIPIPNPGLAEWLRGPECYAAMATIASEIYTIYQNTVPAPPSPPGLPRTGNLRDKAYWSVEMGGWGTDKDRWFGIIGNRAVSYRGQLGMPYPRYVEGGTRRMAGQHQFRDAVAAVTGEVLGGGLTIPGITHDPRGRGSQLRGPGGKFIKNPLESKKGK